MNLIQDGCSAETVGFLYRTIFGREPDKAGLGHWTGRKLADVMLGLLNSPEYFSRKYNAESFLDAQIEAEPWRALHIARKELIQQRLPQAQRVLDLCGGHSSDPKGSLLSDGYPYRPSELHIVDLPTNVQLGPSGDRGKSALTWGGTSIHFHYRSMKDLEIFDDEYFDMVWWSGEAKEYVREHEAHEVFDEVARVLKPKGVLCLDSPNRKLTSLHVGDRNLAHYKSEYRFAEFKDKFARHGLTIVDTCGIVHMPRSVRAGRFMMDEYKENRSINEDPDNSYMFYIAYAKA